MPIHETYSDTVRLQFYSSGAQITVQKQNISIGRDAACDIRLSNPAIARYHAFLLYENGNWFLQSVHATNGLWLNGRRLAHAERCVLRPNDVIEFPAGIEKITFLSVPEQALPLTQHAGPQSIIAHRFRLLNQISHSGPLTRCQALDETTGQKCVIRICPKTETTKQLQHSLLSEKSWLEAHCHPALPTVYCMTEDTQYLYFVEEFIQGETLDTVLFHRGVLPVSIVADWAIQICSFLCHLHRSTPPQVHSDIQPSSLLLQADGKIRVIRYLRAISNDASNNLHLLPPEQPGYAAPEQFPGGLPADTRTDIFGLGMTMYYLLSGHDPNDPPYGIPKFWWNTPEIPQYFRTVVQKCTRSDPSQRYQTAEELLHALKQCAKNAEGETFIARLFRRK